MLQLCVTFHSFFSNFQSLELCAQSEPKLMSRSTFANLLLHVSCICVTILHCMTLSL